MPTGRHHHQRHRPRQRDRPGRRTASTTSRVEEEAASSFTDNPEELPRLFAQDTFVVARSTFLEEPTPIQTDGGLVSLTGKRFEAPPSIGGYNLCYLRPEASLAAVSVDEYKAPVVAAWQAGAGRALCYTGEADGDLCRRDGQVEGRRRVVHQHGSLDRG